ncbi:MAG: class I SAM-dependent methyltransferase [Candidatus Heimdallarchaeota archaeon]|nr:class I SAM-dependent methyltransferase [Candidatus Heimdallarchaeota archaeon]
MEVRSTTLAYSGADKIVKKLKEISGGKILDIGTGGGGFVGFLKQALKSFDSFIGIDLNEEKLKKAEKRFGTIAQFKKMNAEKLDFQDETFDVVSMASSLHHLERPEEVLKEMFRVVKPQGYLIIQEMYSNLTQTEAQLTTLQDHHFGAKIDTLLGEYHRETYTKEEIKGIVSILNAEELEIFDSTRYPKCLFCEEKEQCDNPMDKELIQSQIKYLKSSLEKISDYPEYEQLEKEAKKIEQDLRKNGITDASILFILAKKN